MAHLFFEVISGSTGEVYYLEAKRTAAGVRFSCTCAAAENGSFCKHRVKLLSRSVDGLRSGTPEDIEKLVALHDGSAAARALAEIAVLDAEADRLKKRLSKAKKELGKAFMG